MAFLSVFASLLAALGLVLAIDIDLSSPARDILAIAIFVLVQVVNHKLVAPRLLAFVDPYGDEVVRVYGEDQPVEADLSAEQKHELREMFGLGESETGLGGPWRCDSCGESNSKEFRLCWNCSNEYRDPN